MPTKRQRKLQRAIAEACVFDPAIHSLQCCIAEAEICGDSARAAQLRTFTPLPRTPTNRGSLGRVYGGHKAPSQPSSPNRSAHLVPSDIDISLEDPVASRCKRCCTSVATKGSRSDHKEEALGSPVIRAVGRMLSAAKALVFAADHNTIDSKPATKHTASQAHSINGSSSPTHTGRWAQWIGDVIAHSSSIGALDDTFDAGELEHIR